MKTAHEVAAEVAATVAEHGTQKFMGNRPYTPNEFRAEIAERAILADRAQRSEPVVVIRNGEAFEGKGVEVINLDFLDYEHMRSDFDQEDIDRMLDKLTRAGLPSAAADVREWWINR